MFQKHLNSCTTPYSQGPAGASACGLALLPALWGSGRLENGVVECYSDPVAIQGEHAKDRPRHFAHSLSMAAALGRLSPRLWLRTLQSTEKKQGPLRKTRVHPGPKGGPCWDDFLTQVGKESYTIHWPGILGTVKGSTFSLMAEREGTRPRLPRELFTGW